MWSLCAPMATYSPLSRGSLPGMIATTLRDGYGMGSTCTGCRWRPSSPTAPAASWSSGLENIFAAASRRSGRQARWRTTAAAAGRRVVQEAPADGGRTPRSRRRPPPRPLPPSATRASAADPATRALRMARKSGFSTRETGPRASPWPGSARSCAGRRRRCRRTPPTRAAWPIRVPTGGSRDPRASLAEPTAMTDSVSSARVLYGTVWKYVPLSPAGSRPDALRARRRCSRCPSRCRWSPPRAPAWSRRRRCTGGS